LGALEAAIAVSAVAERFVFRLAAPAEGVRFLGWVERKLVAQMIDHFDRTRNHQRTILATADNERIGHFPVLHDEGSATLFKA
jgi:hypothetical protein